MPFPVYLRRSLWVSFLLGCLAAYRRRNCIRQWCHSDYCSSQNRCQLHFHSSTCLSCQCALSSACSSFSASLCLGSPIRSPFPFTSNSCLSVSVRVDTSLQGLSRTIALPMASVVRWDASRIHSEHTLSDTVCTELVSDCTLPSVLSTGWILVFCSAHSQRDI